MTSRPQQRALLLSRLVLSVVLLLAGAGCAASAGPGQPDQRTPQARQQRLEGWRSRTDAPAAVAGLSEPRGTTWLGASGTVERGGTGAAVDPTATFRIASITKVFVAVTVLQLVEEGVLRLDEPVSTYLPDAPAGPVTVRQLLNTPVGCPTTPKFPRCRPSCSTTATGAGPVRRCWRWCRTTSGRSGRVRAISTPTPTTWCWGT